MPTEEATVVERVIGFSRAGGAAADSMEKLLDFREAVRQIYVDREVVDHAVELADATRCRIASAWTT